ncbi:MAG: GerMN domain-containing protein [Clostridia bacterium]|nr:GerMN domain-containing protein [Clostridia bacterium]
MRKLVCIVTVCVMIITMFSGCGLLQKLGFEENNDELRPVSSIVMNEEDAKKITDKLPVRLYFVEEDSKKLKLDVRYVPLSEAKKSTSSLATAIVKELINGPSTESGLKATIPEGAELRSPVSIKGNVATVNFSKAFVDKHPGGSTAEKLTLYSIVNSLTELKDIEKVKFTIEGKTRPEFKGSFQFDAPFPRDTAIISRSVSKPDSVVNSDSEDDANPVDKKSDSGKQESSKEDKNSDTKKIDNSKGSGDKTKQTSGDIEEEVEETYLEILE